MLWFCSRNPGVFWCLLCNVNVHRAACVLCSACSPSVMQTSLCPWRSRGLHTRYMSMCVCAVGEGWCALLCLSHGRPGGVVRGEQGLSCPDVEQEVSQVRCSVRRHRTCPTAQQGGVPPCGHVMKNDLFPCDHVMHWNLLECSPLWASARFK